MKHFLRFVAGGWVYYWIEVVFRLFKGHIPPSLLMIPMGGAVFVVLMLVEDKKLPILLGSFLSALTIVASELVIGAILLYGFGKRYWWYGRINFKGLIALDWSFIWWGVCLAVLLARRLLLRYLAKRKGKKQNGSAV